MIVKLKIILALAVYLIVERTIATTISDISVTNSVNKSTVTVCFNKKPIYAFFSLHNPERFVIDIRHNRLEKRLPLDFSNKSVIKRIRAGAPLDKKSTRLVFELTRKSLVQAKTQQIKGHYNIILTVKNRKSYIISPVFRTGSNIPILSKSLSRSIKKSSIKQISLVKNSPTIAMQHEQLPKNTTIPVVVAIDAGHGGQDPGATSPNGLYEKNITIAIARKLKKLLDQDKTFKPVLTRDGDYFISVISRSDFARKKSASVLVSIHADAALNRNANGASVWVLSNQRANNEMSNWLEKQEKQSKLLGGASDLLASTKADPYLNQAVLDLQFGHSQRVGYDIAVKVLSQLQRVSVLHKSRPEYASLGILRSPDIPSLLVETGFISNSREERLLNSGVYQDKIAKALYLGLHSYFIRHPLSTNSKLENHSHSISSITNIKNDKVQEIPVFNTSILIPISSLTTAKHHIVKRDETLCSISRQYKVSTKTIYAINKLKRKDIRVGQILNIPSNSNRAASRIAVLQLKNNTKLHQIVLGDTLTKIALRYGVSTKEIKHYNNMVSNKVLLGKTLNIPPS